MYVMSSTGNIHVSRHIVGHQHHSSLLIGFMVAGAGEMKCHQGKLVELSNKSGHYCPSVSHLLQTLHQLQRNQIPLDFKLQVFPGGHFYSTVDAFMAKLNADGVHDFELARLLRYHRYLRNEILGKHQPEPWHWSDGSDGKPIGVYTETNVMVPHKVVRQWLKGHGMFAQLDIQTGKGR
jgi:hypothetical protein